MSNARFRGGRQPRVEIVGQASFGPPDTAPARWSMNWRKLGVALCGLMLLAAVACVPFFINACAVTREAPIRDKATGADLYLKEVVDADGTKREVVTTEAMDENGKPRKRATVPVSSGQIEQATDTARSLTSMLPPPFGFFAEAAVGVGGFAALAVIRSLRRKRLEELGLNEEAIEIIDQNEEARKLLTNKASPKLDARVREVRSKRRVAPKPA